MVEYFFKEFTIDLEIKKMTLRSKTMGKNTFLELHSSCMYCWDKGVMTAISSWTHKNCGGLIYIGDNAHYLCDKCDLQKPVSYGNFHCPNHDSTSEIPQMSFDLVVNYYSFPKSMMLNQTSVDWLNKFLKNLEIIKK